MKQYLVKRFILLIPILIGITLLAFLLGTISPGNPAELALSSEGYSPTPEQIEEMEIRMGLNEPILVQYGNWLTDVVSGDLGTSYATNLDIGSELMRLLPTTLKLTFFAMILTLTFGILFGSISAANRGKPIDKFICTMVNINLSFPTFWLALILILIFAENLGILPTSGNGGFIHMILPAVTLAAASSSIIIRQTRATLLKEFTQQYYLAATARGLKKLRLVFCHALPNAIIPIVAMLGNTLGGMLGGSVIIESIFALPGIGNYALDAISNRDYPAIQGYVLLAGVTFIVISFLVDAITASLNPKIRLGGKTI